MKRTFVIIVLVACLCNLVTWLSGCAHSLTDLSQPGETMAEGNRRHLRNNRINQQQMMKDVDRMFLYDRPSGLGDTMVP